MSAPRVFVRAPAKINLTLRVTGRRADGYHLLHSLFAFTEWGDDLIIEPATDISLSLEGERAEALAGEHDNLVLRAARLLQKASGAKADARLALTKRIPVAAGLGGGSADAAATLRGLNALWRLNWPVEKLEELALQLGADVPACVHSAATIATGIGEVLSAAPPLPPLAVVLVNPNLPTPTPAVFRALKDQQGTKPFKQEPALPSAFGGLDDLISWMSVVGNDLTDPAIQVTPAVADVLTQMRSTAGIRHAALSGSGATGFGLCTDIATAETCAKAISKARPDWFAIATRLLK